MLFINSVHLVTNEELLTGNIGSEDNFNTENFYINDIALLSKKGNLKKRKFYQEIDSEVIRKSNMINFPSNGVTFHINLRKPKEISSLLFDTIDALLPCLPEIGKVTFYGDANQIVIQNQKMNEPVFELKSPMKVWKIRVHFNHSLADTNNICFGYFHVN